MLKSISKNLLILTIAISMCFGYPVIIGGFLFVVFCLITSIIDNYKKGRKFLEKYIVPLIDNTIAAWILVIASDISTILLVYFK